MNRSIFMALFLMSAVFALSAACKTEKELYDELRKKVYLDCKPYHDCFSICKETYEGHDICIEIDDLQKCNFSRCERSLSARNAAEEALKRCEAKKFKG